MGFYVISYDIGNPKRLLRIHHYLKGLALPIQYSVFYFEGSEVELKKCIAKLTTMIDSKEDDVRCYPLPKTGLQVCLGKAGLPNDIYYSEQPTSELTRLNKP